MIVLCKGNENSRDYAFINTHCIKRVEMLDNNPERLDEEIPNVDIEKLIRDMEAKINR